MSQVTYGALTIRAGNGKRTMGEDGRYRRLYNVRIHSDATGAEVRFDFTDSIANEEAGKQGLAKDELLWAFRCFVEDALAGESSFEDFASDYGYDLDSYSARQIHKACKRASAKFAKLYHDGRDPADVVNALADDGIE